MVTFFILGSFLIQNALFLCCAEAQEVGTTPTRENRGNMGACITSGACLTPGACLTLGACLTWLKT